jgi:hypothetical protein
MLKSLADGTKGELADEGEKEVCGCGADSERSAHSPTKPCGLSKANSCSIPEGPKEYSWGKL